MPELILILTVAVLFLGSLASLALILYLRQYQKYQHLLKQNYPGSVKQSQEKSYSILHKAFKRSQQMIGLAELESIKTMAEGKFIAKKLDSKYEAQLSQNLNIAQEAFARYLSDLKTQGEQAQLLSQEFTQQKVNEIFEKFEQNLTNFLTSTEQKSVSAIELELKATRQLIDTYKAQQLSLIDENIIAMLEKTLSLVLVNKITLKDEVDLVYEALEKAKAEKFIN